MTGLFDEVYSSSYMMSAARQRKCTLGAVFFTFFIDALSWSIVFPIFAPFFLDVKNHLFSSSVSMASRTAILGIFIAVFSFGQFVGAPFLGEFADRRGRKKTLCQSIFCAFIGMVLSALGLQWQNLYLLFAGRILTGVFAGNMSICMASVADVCADERDKIAQFSRISTVTGLAFIVGAFLGGKLSDSTISSWFSPALPLWLATGLTLLNWLFVVFAFPETGSAAEVSFSAKEYFINMRRALKIANIRSMMGIYFLFLFAWTLVLQFVPVLTVRRFHFTNSNLGDLALFMGIVWALSSGYLNQVFSKFISSIKIMEGCLIGFTIFCALLIFSWPVYYVLLCLVGCVMVGAIAWPHCNGLISNAAPPEMQGQFMGFSQALQSLAMTIAPAIGGLGYQLFSGFPFFIGAMATLSAAIFYFSSNIWPKKR